MSIPIQGLYRSGASVLHRLDARAKILCSLAMIGIVFLTRNYAGLAVCSGFVALFFAAAKLPFANTVKSLVPLFLIVLLTAFMNVLFVQGGTVYFSWWVICIGSEGIGRAAFMAWRLSLLVLIMGLLVLTTSMLDITEALERFFSPLARIGFPAHEMAMIMGIALRFLPQLSLEFEAVRMAQESRGAYYSKNKLALIKSLIMPLFSSALRHAESLSVAMDSRCYHGGVGRTRLHPLRFSRLDILCVVLILAMLSCVLAANILL